MTERPNFLFLITDQLRHDYLGCAGHPVVKTPHIDSIAAQGTRFDRFYTASPVCMPNRASLLTGRYPTVHGLRYNGCVLPHDATTFVDVLRAQGYRTAAIGKSHLQPFTEVPPHQYADEDELGPFPEARHTDGSHNSRRYDQEEPGRYVSDDRYAFNTPYYGYDEVDMVTGHGANTGGHYAQWLRTELPDWKSYHQTDNELAHTYSCPQAYRTPLPEEYYSTSYIRDRTVQFLDSHANAESPFFAFVSFPDPHHPFTPPGRYWDMYDPDQFDVSLPFESHTNPPPPLSAAHADFISQVGPKTAQTAIMVNNQHVKEAMALSCGMISMVDDAIGTILQSLKASGLADNTVIVFTSDHGDYLGDYNLLLKGAWPLDSINRAPFIWMDPNSQGVATANTLASTIDIAPTIMARAGVKPYWGLQGQSLLESALSNASIRESLLVEYNDGLARMGFEHPARVRTLITDQFRLSMYKDQSWGEFYDRSTDPDDAHNLWDDPGYASQRSDLQAMLVHHLIDMMDESPRATRLA